MAEQKKPARNGGRPCISSVPGAYQKRVSITVDDVTRSRLERAGNGNLSAGIRIAARLLDQASRHETVGVCTRNVIKQDKIS